MSTRGRAEEAKRWLLFLPSTDKARSQTIDSELVMLLKMPSIGSVPLQRTNRRLEFQGFCPWREIEITLLSEICSVSSNEW